MRTLLTVLICSGLFFNALGQAITFNAVEFNPCDSTFKKALVELVKDGKVYQEFADTKHLTLVLPEPGVYTLREFGGRHFNMFYNSDSLITISRGRNIDTLFRRTILKCIKGGADHPNPDCGYLCCDKPCEGYNADFFQNGIKRIEGTFRNGFPIGSLKFYYGDGKIRDIHVYDMEGKGKRISTKHFEH